MDKVSIIIPYFNKKRFIEKTIKSILNQTYKNFEVIIIYDDIKKDDLSFINSFKYLDKRIKIIINKKNLGAGLSRNIGIFKSKGKYISFIDADDTWKKNKLYEQINFMKSNNLLITHTSYDIVNSKGNKIGERKARNFLNLKSLLKSCDIGLSTVTLKKSIFKKNLKFSNMKTKEDFVFWLKLLEKNYKIYSLPKNLTKWTKLDNSLSSPTLQKLKDGFKVYNIHLKQNVFVSFYFLLCLSFNYLIKK